MSPRTPFVYLSLDAAASGACVLVATVSNACPT